MWKYTLVALAGLSAAFAPAPLPKPKDPNRERKKLNGTWVRVRNTVSGNIVSDSPGPMRMVIGEDKLQYVPSAGPPNNWALTVDVKKKPPVFDIKPSSGNPGQTFLGIYRLEGDTLTVCSRTTTNEKERPASLDDSRPGVYLEVFKRVKP